MSATSSSTAQLRQWLQTLGGSSCWQIGALQHGAAWAELDAKAAAPKERAMAIMGMERMKRIVLSSSLFISVTNNVPVGQRTVDHSADRKAMSSAKETGRSGAQASRSQINGG